MKNLCSLIVFAISMPVVHTTFAATEGSILTDNPVYIELYTRDEEKSNKGVQGIYGRMDFLDSGFYFAPEVNTDHYYEWAFGKTWKPSQQSYIDVYLARTPWNNRVSLRSGYSFDNGISISLRVRPEFGYDNWIKNDAQGESINYGKNLSVRTDMFISYNTENYEFFYNRVDLFETKHEIADQFHYGKRHFETDHEFRITYTRNKWRPYFQYTYMVDGYNSGNNLQNENRWQLGFALPM